MRLASLCRSVGIVLGFSALATFAMASAGCVAARPQSPKPLDLVLEEGSEYVPNRTVTLPREYWVVIRSPRGATYMFPRPDGRPELTAACTKGDAFAAELQDYRLCNAAASAADVNRVNALPEALAMRVSTRLHETLRFHREKDGIDPFPYNTDVVAVCERDAAARNGFLKARCDRELAAKDGGDRAAIAYAWTEGELAELPSRLNALYGIAP
jgi:hypothetical protein